ncbi:MAG: ubiquitin-like domain-containing protein [Anaerolineae bacterium]|nr:ubiquitin-like domain-containing protein [Candidatus Roseilinea sp.]MDW8451815.1 ubiquitin-like domain-containing protein [Anaerolineae bacterium]
MMGTTSTPEPPLSAGKPRPRRLRWLAIPIILGVFSLLTVGYLNTFTPATIIDGDKVINLRTHQTTVEGALREAGIELLPEDIVLPDKTAALNRNDTIVIQRARLVQLLVDNEEPKWIRTQRTRGSEVLADLGYSLSVNDLVSVNGSFDDVLPAASKPRLAPESALVPSARLPDARIELRRAVPLTIQEVGGQTLAIKTSARTVGEALLQAGFMVYLADKVVPGLGTPVQPDMQVTIERAKPVTIWVDGRQVRTRTLHDTVADVLAEMNIVLLEQDYAQPALDAPVAPNTEIRVVRIKREIQIAHDYIPFETIWQADPELELDTQVLAQEGARGVRERRSLVTFEDGLEVKRELIADFVARPPQPRVYKYGTKVVIRTLDTPQGPVQYWRKIRMLATSYSASTAGVSRNSSWYGRTRCGQNMRFGIVAVDPRIINLGSNVYVPGYGVGNACDTGSAITGKRIDLGYDDDNLKLWYRWVDVYLLTPVPNQIRYRLE